MPRARPWPAACLLALSCAQAPAPPPPEPPDRALHARGPSVASIHDVALVELRAADTVHLASDVILVTRLAIDDLTASTRSGPCDVTAIPRSVASEPRLVVRSDEPGECEIDVRARVEGARALATVNLQFVDAGYLRWRRTTRPSCVRRGAIPSGSKESYREVRAGQVLYCASDKETRVANADGTGSPQVLHELLCSRLDADHVLLADGRRFLVRDGSGQIAHEVPALGDRCWIGVRSPRILAWCPADAGGAEDELQVLVWNGSAFEARPPLRVPAAPGLARPPRWLAGDLVLAMRNRLELRSAQDGRLLASRAVEDFRDPEQAGDFLFYREGSRQFLAASWEELAEGTGLALSWAQRTADGDDVAMLHAGGTSEQLVQLSGDAPRRLAVGFKAWDSERPPAIGTRMVTTEGYLVLIEDEVWETRVEHPDR